ncbi:MAG: Mur ligase family protein, partial [bacterium]|nr:Mur ligase family protein [bacterium]
MILFKIIIFVIALHTTLYWVWYWQIKEYRRDRFLAGLTIRNFLDQFNLRYWFRPKLTLRGALTLIISLIFVPVNLIFAPLTVAMCVGFITPMFIIYKKYLIAKVTGKFKGIVIGITGSYGKSSTKELLTHVLSLKFKVAKTPKNVNSEIGIAQTVLKLKGDEEVFVVEMGAYKRGEIKAICNIVKPKIGIITGIG